MPAEDASRQSPLTSHPLATDDSAATSSAGLPGFLARPIGAPVYHGFRILDDVVVEGFTFGAITDFESEPTTEGDAFVIAPDGSRAGLVWKVSDAGTFDRICANTDERWGVWAVCFPFPMTRRENVEANLAANINSLKAKWREWKNQSGPTEAS